MQHVTYVHIFAVVYAKAESTKMASQAKMDKEKGHTNGAKKSSQILSTIVVYVCLLFIIM